MTKIGQWLLKYWLDVLLLALLITMFWWVRLIATGPAVNKAQWLLLPITGIYVIVSVYMACGAILAARASQRSAEAMEHTLAEMRLSRQLQYSPWFSFPNGHRCALRVDGSVHLQLRNLFAVPIPGLWIMLWEMEASDGGGVPTVKYSSMREAPPCDYTQEESLIDAVLQPSARTDEEKVQSGRIAEEEFRQRFGASPSQSLLAILYYVKGETQPRTLFYDFEIVAESTPTSQLREGRN